MLQHFCLLPPYHLPHAVGPPSCTAFISGIPGSSSHCRIPSTRRFITLSLLGRTNIVLDDNFAANSSIEVSTSQLTACDADHDTECQSNESFDCSLGVDPQVKLSPSDEEDAFSRWSAVCQHCHDEPSSKYHDQERAQRSDSPSTGARANPRIFGPTTEGSTRGTS
jgi:hypothetical protein